MAEITYLNAQVTLEEKAAQYKRQLTEHLERAKGIMDAAIADGFQVAFQVGDEVRVTLTKTF